jgi:hypothetical protein
MKKLAQRLRNIPAQMHTSLFMKIFIPTIGTKLVVTEPWYFRLHDEYRNYDFWTDFTGQPPKRDALNSSGWQAKYARQSKPIDITLPGRPLPSGHLHPITQTLDEIGDI